jgi:hypothetical protein
MTVDKTQRVDRRLGRVVVTRRRGGWRRRWESSTRVSLHAWTVAYGRTARGSRRSLRRLLAG